MGKIYFKSWLIFFLLFIFFAKIIKLIFVFPVNIILIFFGLNPKSAPYVSEYGSLIANILLSFALYTWTIRTFIIPRLGCKKYNNKKS